MVCEDPSGFVSGSPGVGEADDHGGQALGDAQKAPGDAHSGDPGPGDLDDLAADPELEVDSGGGQGSTAVTAQVSRTP